MHKHLYIEGRYNLITNTQKKVVELFCSLLNVPKSKTKNQTFLL